MIKIWVLVVTQRGLIEKPRIFFDQSKALSTKEKLSKHLNPDYDEIELFEHRLLISE